MRNGVANLCSLPALERLGFHVKYDTLDEWVVTSPKGGATIVFKRDTGRCDRFPYVFSDDPATEDFFVAARDELREGESISEHFFSATALSGGLSPRPVMAKRGADPL